MKIIAAIGITILGVHARPSCEKHCVHHCSELNGNILEECGACVGAEWLCRPGSAEFPGPALAAEAAAEECTDRADHNLCSRLKSEGRCASEPDEMHRVCQMTCEACGHPAPPEPPRADVQRTLPIGTSQESWCGDPEDESRLADRGFFVWRQAVPKHELRLMQRRV